MVFVFDFVFVDQSLCLLIKICVCIFVCVCLGQRPPHLYPMCMCKGRQVSVGDVDRHRGQEIANQHLGLHSSPNEDDGDVNQKEKWQIWRGCESRSNKIRDNQAPASAPASWFE